MVDTNVWLICDSIYIPQFIYRDKSINTRENEVSRVVNLPRTGYQARTIFLYLYTVQFTLLSAIYYNI